MSAEIERLRAEAGRLLADLPLTVERIAAWNAFIEEAERVLDETAAKVEELTAELGAVLPMFNQVKSKLAEITEKALRLQNPGGVTRH